MNRRARRDAVVLITLLCACSSADVEEPDVQLLAPDRVVLTGTVRVDVIDHCPTDPTCSPDLSRAVLEEIAASDPAVLGVTKTSENAAMLTGLREGTVTLRATGRSSTGRTRRELTKTIAVAPADRVSWGPAGCKAPVLIGTNESLSVTFHLWHGNDELAGEPPRDFFLVDGMEVRSRSNGIIDLWTGPSTIDGSVRTTVAGDVGFPVSIVGPDEVTSIEVHGPSGETLDGRPLIDDDASFRVTASIGIAGREICREQFPRTGVVQTPDVCEIADPKAIAKGPDGAVVVRAKKPGTCTVEIAVGSKARQSFTVEVRRT